MTLAQQWVTVSLMIFSGLCLGLLLELYRVIKKRFAMPKWVLSLLDLFYWVLSSVLVFLFLWWSNWGELRFYLLMAIFFGLYGYQRWLSSTFHQILTGLFRVVEQILIWIYRLWLHLGWIPLVRIIQLIRSALTWLMGLTFFPLRWMIEPLAKKLRPLRNKWWKGGK